MIEERGKFDKVIDFLVPVDFYRFFESRKLSTDMKAIIFLCLSITIIDWAMDDIIPFGISGMTMKHFLPLATKIVYGFIMYWLLMYMSSFLLNLVYRVKEIFGKQKEDIAVPPTFVEVVKEEIVDCEISMVKEEVPLEITEAQTEDVPISALSIIDLPNPAILENYIKDNKTRFSNGEGAAMLYDILIDKEVTEASLKSFWDWLCTLIDVVTYKAVAAARKELKKKMLKGNVKSIKNYNQILDEISRLII